MDRQQRFDAIPEFVRHQQLAHARKVRRRARLSSNRAQRGSVRHSYNRFHDSEEHDPEIQKLRDLHAEMDEAVLSAYGWSDISTHCKFFLDDEEAAEEEGGKRRKKKPYRYRWPDEVRDEVLARLIALNQERAAEERRLGLAPKER